MNLATRQSRAQAIAFATNPIHRTDQADTWPPFATSKIGSGVLQRGPRAAVVSVSDGKFPYIMKLCFSSSRTIPTSFPPSSGSASSNSAGNGHVKMQQDSE